MKNWRRMALASYLKQLPYIKIISVTLKLKTKHLYEEKENFVGTYYICSEIHNIIYKVSHFIDLATPVSCKMAIFMWEHHIFFY